MNKRLFTLPLIGMLAFSLAALVLFAAGSVQAQATPRDLEIPATPAPPEKSPSLADVIHGIEAAFPQGTTAGGDWDGYRIDHPRVISDTDSGIYRMWYSGFNPANPGFGWDVGMATSEDGLTWTKDASNPVLGLGDPGEWDDSYRGQGAILKELGGYRMWYSGARSTGPWQTGLALSSNGTSWSTHPSNPLLTAGPSPWEAGESDGPSVIYDGGIYKMWYHGCEADFATCQIGYATSPTGIVWTKHGAPVLPVGGAGEWDEGFVIWPRVIKTGSNSYRMWYFSNGQIGTATSTNGTTWVKYLGNPVISEGWDGAGLRGFDVILDGGIYKMWLRSGFGASDGIGYAWSPDGIDWNLHPGNPVLTSGMAGITMDVNYSHDWVSSWTEPGEPVTLTVSDGGGVKATQTGVANEEGWFDSWEHTWIPEHPDILPGDTVIAETADATTSVDPVGSIDGAINPDTDTLSGNLHAPGSTPLTVLCHMDVADGPQDIVVDGVAPDGGAFSCNYGSQGWDIQAGQDISVQYYEPDGDSVMAVFGVPWVRVNYGHDWVGGNYPAGHTFWITVTNSISEVKATAEVQSANGWGWGGSGEGFETRWEDWSSPLPDVQQPDIQPGDWVELKSDDGYTNLIHVGQIDTLVDAETDVVSGNLHAAWFDPTPLTMRCEIWTENGGDMQIEGIDPDGGEYVCDFSGHKDILAGQDIAVQYLEPDGDRVMGVFGAPWVRINYGHDWVGGNYPVGHTFWITVTNEIGEIKAFAEVQSAYGMGWGAGSEGFETGGEDWQPRHPDIQPGDWVYFTSDDGYSNAVQVGEITGDVDVDNNSVSGLVYADWFSENLDVECHPWGAPGGVEGKSSSAAPDGSSPYLCQWPVDEWDILAGQEIGVMYLEPDGDRVINPQHAPAPNLSISTWTDGSPTTGGNMDFYVEYWNQGDVTAENAVVTATLEGMSYVANSLSSGFVITGTLPGGEFVILDLGDLPPGNLYRRFHLFTQVTAPVSNTVTNTVQIGTSTVYGNWDEGQRQNTWSGHVEEINTHINVGKWAWTGDPTPGEDFVWVVNPCNFGSTGSTALQVTDDLPAGTVLVEWWSQQPGWTEVSASANSLIVERPSLAGNRCSEVYLRVHLDEDTPIGTQLTNHVEIAASNDLETDDNATTADVWASLPRNNLWVDVAWNWGTLVPGGEIRYNINYGNGGNTPVTGPVLITETLPANTTFVAAWRNDDTEQSPVTPISVTGEYVVWQIDGLDAGFGGNFEVVLNIDGAAQPGDVLVNRLEISPVEDEERYDDNASEWIESVYGNGPNLRVRKEGDWHGHGEGHNAWFNIILENVGDEWVEQAVVTDTLPISMTLMGDPGTDWSRVMTYTRDPDSKWFSMIFRDVHANFRRDINFDVQIEDPDPVPYGLLFTNMAEVNLIPDDTDPGDNQDQATLATGPDLYIEKSLVAGELYPGEAITMSLRFGNNLPGHAWWWRLEGNAVLTDTLPAGLEFLHSEQRFCGDTYWCERTPLEDGNKLTWEFWRLWTSEWNEIYITLRIADNARYADILTNLAEIASDQPDVDIEPYSDNNTASLELFINLPYKLFLPVLRR